VTATKRSARASARRSTLKALDDIRATLDNMRSWWTVRSTIYIPREERPADDPNGYQRPRRQEEYPEAQRRYWSGTVAGIDKMITDLYALREACVAEYHKTEES
jgi:hypothetical protein